MTDSPKPSRLVTLIANIKVRRRTYNWLLLGKLLAISAVPVLLLGASEATWCYWQQDKSVARCITQKFHVEPPKPTLTPPTAPTMTMPAKVTPKPKRKPHVAKPETF